MKKILCIFSVFILVTGVAFSAPKKKTTKPTATAPQTEVLSPQPSLPPNPFFTGDGGKGKSIAILAPKSSGLAANQNYLPALVQGEFVSNFSGYSAISVLDRQKLDEVYAEQLSGYYNDNAGLDLGHLQETDYVQTGSITRTATGYALQIQIIKTADKMTAASYSGTCTFAELDNLTGVRRASLDLLQKMGVTPTERAKTELSGAAADNQINAQTALAHGLVAQQMGNTAETLAQYYQAAAYDPTLAEAAARANTMSASVRTGSLGANIRNDIAWRDEWVKILADANTALKNMPIPQPPVFPQQITVARMVVPPDPQFKQGDINYTARTVQLTAEFKKYMWFGLESLPYPDEYLKALDAYYTAFKARNNAYNKLVNDLNAGLRATGRNSAWKLNELNTIKQDANTVYPRNGEVTVSAMAELLNDEGRVIASANNNNIGRLKFDERGTAIIGKDDISINNFVFNVKADDITDNMSLRVTANANPAQNNQVQVTTGIVIKGLNVSGNTITGYTGTQKNIVIPSVINGVTITKIGDKAFLRYPPDYWDIPKEYKNLPQLTSVTIPNSVTSIGAGTFFSNFDLNNVTIGANVKITKGAFSDFVSDIGIEFDEFYNQNGKKAGTYTRSGNGSIFSPHRWKWKRK